MNKEIILIHNKEASLELIQYCDKTILELNTFSGAYTYDLTAPSDLDMSNILSVATCQASEKREKQNNQLRKVRGVLGRDVTIEEFDKLKELFNE